MPSPTSQPNWPEFLISNAEITTATYICWHSLCHEMPNVVHNVYSRMRKAPLPSDLFMTNLLTGSMLTCQFGETRRRLCHQPLWSLGDSEGILDYRMYPVHYEWIQKGVGVIRRRRKRMLNVFVRLVVPWFGAPRLTKNTPYSKPASAGNKKANSTWWVWSVNFLFYVKHNG